MKKINKIIKILKKNVLYIVIIGIAVFITIFYFLKNESLNNKDWLDFIDIIATLIVGTLTFYVTKKLTDLDSRRYAYETGCKVVLEKVDDRMDKNLIELSNEPGNVEGGNEFRMTVKNYSDAFLNMIEFRYADYDEPIFVSHLIVPKDTSKSYKLDIGAFGEGDKIYVTFISCYNEKTYADFEICSPSNYDDSEDSTYVSLQYYHFHGNKDSRKKRAKKAKSKISNQKDKLYTEQGIL